MQNPNGLARQKGGTGKRLSRRKGPSSRRSAKRKCASGSASSERLAGILAATLAECFVEEDRGGRRDVEAVGDAVHGEVARA